MKDKGIKILKGTGTVLLIWSAAEIVAEILNVLSLDLSAVGAGTILGDLFVFRAGNAAVPILLSIIGMAAGIAALALAGNDRYSKYLRLFGIALIVIYVIEGVMLVSASPSMLAWIRLVIVLIFAALYLYGAYLLKKEDAAAEKETIGHSF